ncbi:MULTISPECIES: hypothetical protein [unclassified Oceanobacillus]|uniref:hypothetical protein n=1 Tax=unclassified Oceanobacillus TaxID=2630292 RepID=UPI001BEBE724|nr:MULTISPECIES: hypothetical protein [unclassified Oceanobacillus]MBT2600523.1 glycosyltransferase [Oceanobacillus sp. ISL-74]MBT2650681.1 glycosyltransferase [Oceanobacillus sp. ISL-73]
MYALIQDDDLKSRKWSEEIQGIELHTMTGSTNLIPIHIITQILKRKIKPEAVILRYLNDANSFLKTIIRLITNIITLLITKLFGIKLIWICHNVDKESKEYYSYIVNVRRKLVSKFSYKILVTDKYLVKHASRILNVDQSKIDYITFGRPNLNRYITTKDDLHQRITNFIKNNNEDNTIIGYSIGNPNLKVIQPFYTNELIKKADENGIKLKIILGGPIGDFIKKQDFNTYSDLLSNPSVLFLDGKINLNELYISKYIDFYWRIYDDYSVPFTIYNAAYLNKPTLTMDKGFLKEMVSSYGLGEVLDSNMSNLENAINELSKDRTKEYKEFIDTHNWSFGARKLYNIITN